MEIENFMELDSTTENLEIKTVEHDSIICIFCGKKADIVQKANQTTVECRHCSRETKLTNYQEMLDRWIGDIRKEVDRE
jgi:ribosomal protein L37AE/L43A